MAAVEILPSDEHNEELVRQAHPPDWQNPTPTGRYNLIAIGGGTAGIISALGAAGLGGKVALIERHLLGGDCLNYGCVPSKALIRAARAAYESQHGERFGLRVDGTSEVDFAKVMTRMRQLRAKISHHDSAQRFTDLGVDVFLGEARFTGADTVVVDGKELRFHRCVVATGARAFVPPIEGLDATGFLTNETVFSLTELPRRLIVIGGGPIGCELAQSFRRFGSEVDLVDRAPRIMLRDDPDAALVVQRQFESEGIRLHLGASVIRAQKTDSGKQIILVKEGNESIIEGDAVLVAVGRTPNIDQLDLEKGGIESTARGISVDDRLRSTNKRIFAAGDVAGSYQFTHAADAMARICIQNALFMGRKKLSRLVVPHTTYTDPEVAHVGLTLAAAAEKGIEIDSYKEEMSGIDRALLDGEDGGFAVVHCSSGTGRVVGATIVGSHAGEMIGEMTTLMTHNMPLGKLAGVIHTYPTQVEVLKRIADAYQRTRLTPTVAGIFRHWLAWQR